MTQPVFFNHKDEMIHVMLADGQARALLCSASNLVQEAANIHHSTPVVSVALGRMMMGTLMLSSMMKNPTDSVTVNIKGDGPIGTMVAVSSPGKVKAMVSHPEIHLPPLAGGNLPVGVAVGKNGQMSVIKDLGLKEPYIGQVNLVSGEIAEDFTMYFTASEQQPSLLSLGVLTAEESILQAGGLLIQPLPGCSEEVLSQLELRSPMFASISQELSYATVDTLVEDWFRGLTPLIVSREPIKWECDCSRQRMEKALISLGTVQLQEIIQDDQGAELVCHFCGEKYQFTTEELKTLFAQATRE
ncbi:MAG: Hsp33 family molecular chaperone HslO [Clostridiales bacterium]|nr:Hsp33 family molecular chaperone HslO [Clostridiales bacterium]